MWVTMHVPRVKMKGCQLSNNYDNSVNTGPIALKLRMHEGIQSFAHVFRLADESGITYPDLVLEESGTCETCTARLVKYLILEKLKDDSFPLSILSENMALKSCFVLISRSH